MGVIEEFLNKVYEGIKIILKVTMYLIIIAAIISLPIYLAGMLVSILGVSGHIFFYIITFLAIMYYFKFVKNIFNPDLSPKGKKTILGDGKNKFTQTLKRLKYLKLN